jgi:uncharacterized membrane protein
VGSKRANVVVILFLVAQACDGVLTYVGVRLYGLGMEANPLLAWLMGILGQGLALATAKTGAGAVGIGMHLAGVHRVLAALAVFYLIVAILPWIAILFISS